MQLFQTLIKLIDTQLFAHEEEHTSVQMVDRSSIRAAESHLDRKFAEFTKKMYMSSFILYMQFKHFTIMRNAFSEASAVVSRQRRL